MLLEHKILQSSENKTLHCEHRRFVFLASFYLSHAIYPRANLCRSHEPLRVHMADMGYKTLGLRTTTRWLALVAREAVVVEVLRLALR